LRDLAHKVLGDATIDFEANTCTWVFAASLKEPEHQAGLAALNVCPSLANTIQAGVKPKSKQVLRFILGRPPWNLLLYLLICLFAFL